MVNGLGADAPELERLITMKTAECEGVERVGEHFSTAVAARVLTVEPLPKGKNKRVTIDAGDGAIHTVVCGAENVRPELLTAWLPPGTHLELVKLAEPASTASRAKACWRVRRNCLLVTTTRA